MIAVVTAAMPLGAGLAAGPAQAAGPTVVSSNWAGYAVTASRTKFRRVVSTWTVPSGTCRTGSATYSAAWVGLGGYSETSGALEQTGTEFDCTASGRPRYSAWYELVPAVAKTLRMRIAPGDLMAANVEVRGRRVTLTLRNRTTGARFRKLARMKAPDVTSAEWIVEAPSGCTRTGSCRQLPLSNFGQIPFAGARATNTAGHAGPISDPAWLATKLVLVQPDSSGQPGAGASPSDPFSGGTAFTVTYQSQAALPRGRARALPALAR